MKTKKEKQLIPQVIIEQKIFLIRGKKVMLDSDLAVLYGVETKALKRAVKRNIDRFPEDFMFQLSKEEGGAFSRYQFGTLDKDMKSKNLRYQFGTSSHGGSRYLPFAFTEQGVAMLSGILNSKKAIAVNVQIIRTFVRLREMIISNKELRIRLDKLEEKYDKRFKVIFDTLRKLLEDDKNDKKEIKNTRKIGFRCKGKKSGKSIRSRALKSL